MLKLACSENDEFISEINALALSKGEASVQVLEKDLENYAALLELVHPGTQLSEIRKVDDAKATSIVVSVMKKLWKPVPHTHKFKTVADLGKSFAQYKKKFSQKKLLPNAFVEKGEVLYQKTYTYK